MKIGVSVEVGFHSGLESIYVYIEDRPTDRPANDLTFGKIQMTIFARGRPIHFMFGSRVGFSRSADRMANSIGMWEKTVREE